jgi:hypothetical protein
MPFTKSSHAERGIVIGSRRHDNAGLRNGIAHATGPQQSADERLRNTAEDL